MSTDANVTLIRSAYADVQNGDIASLLDRLTLTDDVVWTTPCPLAIVPRGGVRHGKAVRSFSTNWRHAMIHLGAIPAPALV